MKVSPRLKNIPLSEKEIWSVDEAAAVCNMGEERFRREILPQAAAKNWICYKGAIVQIRADPFRRWLRKQTHI